jgi:hypothetical protein
VEGFLLMTDRMMFFRLRQKEKGLVQLRLWVNKEDEEFFKYLAKQSRPQREVVEKKRFGRPASQAQTDFAKEIAEIKNLKEPKHLYNHHISLCGWIWLNRS